MDATTSRRIANIVLGLAILVLVVAIAGRFGWMPQIAPIRELSIVAFVLAIVASRFRRRANAVPPRA